MRVHEALWVYAEKKGNQYAKDYAAARQQIPSCDRARRDSKWLLGKGGLRIRTAWRLLDDSARDQLMRATPDQHFKCCINKIPDQSNVQTILASGILDERTLKAVRVKAKTPKRHKDSLNTPMHAPSIKDSGLNSVSAHATPATTSFPVVQYNTTVIGLTRQFSKARSKYHATNVKERRMLAQIAYDSGSMSGVVNAMISSIESSIQLARCNNTLRTPQDAFTEVAVQVADTFASYKGLTQFNPDPMDPTSPGFAQKRIEAAKSKYSGALMELHKVCERSSDPDSPLLDEPHGFFGRIDGLPSFGSSKRSL
jgi:hypothetical protein